MVYWCMKYWSLYTSHCYTWSSLITTRAEICRRLVMENWGFLYKQRTLLVLIFVIWRVTCFLAASGYQLHQLLGSHRIKNRHHTSVPNRSPPNSEPSLVHALLRWRRTEIAAEWIKHLLRTLDIPCSNSSPRIGSYDWQISLFFTVPPIKFRNIV
jgi:hypothetical protein